MKVPSGWDSSTYQKFQSELLLLEDKTYKEFNFKLIFTDYKKIGIRVPILKELAKKISKNDPFSFLEVVEEEYYEEVLLEGLVIANLKDLKDTQFYLERYIEKIDNWALCDYVISNLKIIKLNKKIFFKKIKAYTKSKDEYRVRFGLVMLLDYYVEKEYIDRIFKICNRVKVDTYYVNMATSWLISECFVKEKQKTLEYLKKNKLNKFTQNKAISKIRESNRVSKNDKMRVLDFKKQ